MLIMSSLCALFGPIGEYFFFKDYWRPYLMGILKMFNVVIAIEDLVFGFVFGGIIAVIYEFFIGKKFMKRERPNYVMLLLIVNGLAIFVALTSILGINSIISCMIAFLINTVIMYIKRKDLIWDIILSGLFTGIIALVFYFIYIRIFPGYVEKVWLLKNTNLGILFLGIPLTEIFWAFTAGMAIGPFYEFLMGYKLKKKNK